MSDSIRMQAAVVSSFGQPDDVLTVCHDFVKPVINPNMKNGDKKVLVKVKAVSLSPGDYRMLLGDKDVVAKPESWPYIPCGDFSGVVEEVPTSHSVDNTPFEVGDDVVGTWTMFGVGCLAEYALVDIDRTVKKPSEVNFLEGAAAANSAVHAMKVVEQAEIKEGDRVLVLGGSGGVGSCVTQFARHAGASFVAVTSTAEKMMLDLGVDKVVNYKKVDWWTVSEFQSNKFDVIIDCAEGVKAWNMAEKVLKTRKGGNGRFVAVVAGEWHIEGHHWGQIIAYLSPPLGRVIYSRLNNNLPKYTMYLGEVEKEDLSKVLGLVHEKKIRIPLDPKAPFSFSTEGVRDAFNLHIQRGGHGKIVIRVSD